MALSLPELLPLLADLNRDRARPRALSELAKALGLSPWYLQRLFARLVGESPSQYQARLRLEAAGSLLVSTDSRIIDIAVSVGFATHESFTRAFTRHFNVSPSDYRRRAGFGSADALHERLVASTGPCVRLYRMSTAPLPNQRSANQRDAKEAMTYTVTRKTLTETPFLYATCRVEHQHVADAVGEAIPKVFGYVMEVGAPMAGPPVVRLVEQSPAFLGLEAGIPLAAPHEPDDRDNIHAGLLPAGPAAVTIHTGPYEGLAAAHAAIDRWLTDNEEKAAGAPWESYLTDPGEVPDPADWKTEVVWPLV